MATPKRKSKAITGLYGTPQPIGPRPTPTVGKAPKPAGSAPRASARARAVASPNAAFNRQGAMPTRPAKQPKAPGRPIDQTAKAAKTAKVASHLMKKK